MTKIIVGLGIFVLLLVAIVLIRPPESRILQPSDTITPSEREAQTVSILSENLEVPWAMAFLPDGRMLVTERPGRVRLVDTNGNVSDPIATIPVHQVSESGLHGVAVDPNFETNKNIYLYYTYRSSGSNTLNRVVRYKFEGEKLLEEKIIVGQIPGAPNHDGGRIKFGPDGLLYITTGDAQQPSLAQDRNSFAGKILRVTRDGNRGPSNPFDTIIYSYGHRNPQGITWDDNGQLWSTEHGRSPGGLDELNLIQAGKNYGWPEIQGVETRSGLITPIINSGSGDTWAPAGTAYFNGSIFFAGLRGSALYEYKISEQKLVEHFKNEYGRLREVVLGPDGMLYVTTSNRDGRGTVRQGNDKILRINPARL